MNTVTLTFTFNTEMTQNITAIMVLYNLINENLDFTSTNEIMETLEYIMQLVTDNLEEGSKYEFIEDCRVRLLLALKGNAE